MAKDYYKILGVDRSASADDIKKAYRKMSKELHPDKHPSASSGQATKSERDEVERKFKEVNEAYEALSDPKKKQMYDQFGTTGNGGGGGGAGAGFGGFDFSGFQNANANVNFSDLFESFFGGAGGGARRQNADRGDDREVAIEIDFAESVTGVEQVLSLRKLATCETCGGNGAHKDAKIVTCSECGGTGQITRVTQSFFGAMQQQVLCPKCKGSGKIPEKSCHKCSGEGRIAESVKVTITVPAGIDDGQTLRLRGQGDAGRRGSEAGDLYVRISVRPDSRFIREGDDIKTKLALPVVDAILGIEADVESVHGLVTFTIPAGTQPGQVFRIKGKGMPVLNSHKVGDHYVEVEIEVPTKLSREERKLMEEWKKLRE